MIIIKKLGIIIPCYNCEETIDDCLNSIIHQKEFDNCELILINDGSTDKTKEKLKKYSIYKNIVIFNQQNKGVSEARNKGINLCNSKYLMFVDSDDLLYENSLFIIFNNINKCRNSLSLYGMNQEFYKNNKLIKENMYNYDEGRIIDLENDSHLLIKYLENGLLNGPYAKIFDLKIIKDHSLLFNKDLKIQEDLCFVIEYLNYIKKVNINKSIVYRYIMKGNNSATSKFMSCRIDNYRFVEKKIYSYYNEKNINNEIRSRLYYISVKNAWSSIINSFCLKNSFSKKERKIFIKEILSKLDYDIIKKASRNGFKYNFLKRILLSNNIRSIYFWGEFFAFLKRKMYINYK